MVMKQVRIADLKARLCEHLRGVRRGQSLNILERETPIARILPYSNDEAKILIRHPLRHSSELRKMPLPPPLKVDVDIVSLLIEERQGER
jgi:antitoxin (DNA-binding transcriptional repressor) of toxin-antitoxin stability system